MQEIIIGSDPIDPTEFATLVEHSSVLQQLFCTMDVVTIEESIDLFLLAIEFYRVQQKPCIDSNSELMFEDRELSDLMAIHEFSNKWGFMILNEVVNDRMAQILLSKSKNSRYHKLSQILTINISDIDKLIDKFYLLNESLMKIPKFDHTTFEGTLIKHPDIVSNSIVHGIRLNSTLLGPYEVKCNAMINGITEQIIIPEPFEFVGLNNKYFIFSTNKYIAFRNNLTYEWKMINAIDMQEYLKYHFCSSIFKTCIIEPFETFFVHNGMVIIYSMQILSIYYPRSNKWVSSRHMSKTLVWSQNKMCKCDPPMLSDLHYTNDSILFRLCTSNLHPNTDNVTSLADIDNWYSMTFEEFSHLNDKDKQDELVKPITECKRWQTIRDAYIITDERAVELLAQKID
jgi:hypothetical protein